MQSGAMQRRVAGNRDWQARLRDKGKEGWKCGGIQAGGQWGGVSGRARYEGSSGRVVPASGGGGAMDEKKLNRTGQEWWWWCRYR